MTESLRVYELARELGVPSHDLLARLSDLSSDPPRSASASVAPELAEAVRSAVKGSENAALMSEGTELIRAAFDAARLSGRDDWGRMTVAVLKNRLLTLTQRQFAEARWGADSFREFVEMFPDVVAVDTSTRPATARYVGDVDESVPGSGAAVERLPPTVRGTSRVLGPGYRIRPDLWQAILDYSSGDVYLWDNGEAVAIPADRIEEADPRPRLRTVDRGTLAEWRAEFAATLRDLPPSLADVVSHWSEGRHPDAVLPRPIRRRWNGALKTHVLSRLGDWFAANNIPLPPDISESRQVASSADTATEKLRQLVISVVSRMTRAELDDLRLSPSALLRAVDDEPS